MFLLLLVACTSSDPIGNRVNQWPDEPGFVDLDTGEVAEVEPETIGGSVNFTTTTTDVDVVFDPILTLDLDRDGDDDVLGQIYGDGHNPYAILISDGNGGVSLQRPDWLNNIRDYAREAVGSTDYVIQRIEAADIDGDRLSDLVVTVLYQNNEMVVLIVLDGETFDGGYFLTQYPFGAPYYQVQLLEDFDNDGEAEQLWFGGQQESLWLSGSDESLIKYDAAASHAFSKGVVIDMDRDGDRDVVVLHNGGFGYTQFSAFFRTGDGWTWQGHMEFPYSIDFAADDDEILLYDSASIYRMLPSGETETVLTLDDAIQPTAFGDFNNDGFLDVLASQTGARSYFFAGTRDGALSRMDLVGWDGQRPATTGDFNQDGRLDLLRIYDNDVIISLAEPLD
ncbi:MAG: VCBS repeat-containing protein [Myxococcota bacterium]